MRRLTVVGTGAWGTALAIQAARAGCDVQLLARTRAAAEELARVRRLPMLGDAPLPTAVEVRGLDAATSLGDAVLAAVPADATVAVARRLAPHLPTAVRFVVCAKGLDPVGPRLLADAVAATLGDAVVAVLSGPSFADEVAADLPTAVALAVGPGHREAGEGLCRALHSAHFRPYLSDDPVGVQIGGAAKNAVAIACGMARGLGFGANAEAALLTRGLAEIARLAAALGARPQTLMGLAGVGDLALSCAGPHSRNFRFGMAVGGGSDADAAEARGGRAEGRKATPLLVRFARRYGVQMPIAEALDRVLDGRLPLAEAIRRLLERPLGSE